MNIITNSINKSAAFIYDFILALTGCFQPTCITLFCGVGGSSLGALKAGFKELIAVDFDQVAQRSFELNFKDEHYVPFWNADIWEITPCSCYSEQCWR